MDIEIASLLFRKSEHTQHDYQTEALQDLKEGKAGAEYKVLFVLAQCLSLGKKIEPAFQAVANSVAAKAIFCGRLPEKKKGRRKDHSDKGAKITEKYLDMLDAGSSHMDAIMDIEHEYGYDERHILRIIKKNKHIFFETKEERDIFRRCYLECTGGQLDLFNKSWLDDMHDFSIMGITAVEVNVEDESARLIRDALAMAFSADKK